MLSHLSPRIVHSHDEYTALDSHRVGFVHGVPILIIHAVCLGVIWVGWSPVAALVAVAFFLLRMFAITAFFHRYFSHRTFRTSRLVQFIFAYIGTASAQRSPVWWASHHRHHHRHSDHDPDMHSPPLRGVLWAHTAWFLTEQGRATNYAAVPDLVKYPELRRLERWHLVPVLTLIALSFGLGEALAAWAPSLGTSGWQMAVWGFGISTTALYHATFTINSLAHAVGGRRFNTDDDSRNNLWLALLTLGEGWHNNHHYHPGSVRQGFYWWEIDISYYILRAMSWFGLVSDLNAVPDRVYEAAEKHRRDRQGEAA